MEAFYLESTFDSPEIEFNPEKGYLRIEGKSIPEDSAKLYQDITDAVADYAQSPNSKTTVDIKLEYFNTSSTRNILEILKILKAIKNSGNDVDINWYFDQFDEEIEESGVDFSNLIGMPFNLKEVPSDN